jgi:hypothetical protein
MWRWLASALRSAARLALGSAARLAPRSAERLALGSVARLALGSVALAGLVALAAFSACGPAPVSYSSFLHQVHQVVCDAQVRCGCGPAAPATAADCVSALDAATDASARAVDAAIANGSVSYSASSATLCLDGLRGGLMTCTAGAETLHGNLRICAQVAPVADGGQPPQLDNGANCMLDVDCTPGICVSSTGVCSSGNTGDLVCLGTSLF